MSGTVCVYDQGERHTYRQRRNDSAKKGAAFLTTLEVGADTRHHGNVDVLLKMFFVHYGIFPLVVRSRGWTCMVRRKDLLWPAVCQVGIAIATVL